MEQKEYARIYSKGYDAAKRRFKTEDTKDNAEIEELKGQIEALKVIAEANRRAQRSLRLILRARIRNVALVAFAVGTLFASGVYAFVTLAW